MKTQQEILDRVEERKKTDFFGFETDTYIPFLTFENAKEFLKEGTTKDQWIDLPPTRENVLKAMEDYVQFAWEKANNCRGLSANRSIQHYLAWIWLLGDEDKLKTIWVNYSYYGKSQLVAICEHYGWNWKNHDNDHWTNFESSDGVTAEVALA